jgi:DNA primase
VISLNQAGIENVVASSGTSLTVEQIRMIKRYTQNITILFDGDKAGIAASLRGIDLILEEGMNVRVVLFPDGSDPDSFVREHRTSEVEAFIGEGSKDFISFKTGLLLEEAENDPIKKAGLVKEIVQTIALIPDAIYRSVYVKTCSKMLDVPEQTLMNELNRLLRGRLRKQVGPDLPETEVENPAQPKAEQDEPALPVGYHQERELLKMLLQYGKEELLFETIDEQGFEAVYRESVAKHILDELAVDGIVFGNPTHEKIKMIYTKTSEKGELPDDRFFTSHPEPDISMLAIDLLADPYELSKNWEKNKIFVKTEREDLKKTVEHALLHYKRMVVEARLPLIAREIQELSDPEAQMELLKQQKKLNEIRIKINHALGIVITK